MLNGDAHYSTLGIEPRIDRCLIFKDYIMHIITDDEPSYHLLTLYRTQSARPHRVLYVGLDLELMKYLEERLDECWITRAPAGCVARPFIEGLKYSLLLFDEVLMDGTAQELTCFTKGLVNREGIPITTVKKSDSFELLALTITGLLLAC